ncbi:MAG: DUF4826 family protein [Planctomycetota bacterium]
MSANEEDHTITDPKEAAWAVRQREVVESYLQEQGCEHAGVSLEPRWFLSPYLAVWAVRSKADPDFIGWWAISGDVPTDYLTATDNIQCVADVLSAFSYQWSEAAEKIRNGEYAGFGSPQNSDELEPLLIARAGLLQKFAAQLREGGL